MAAETDTTQTSGRGTTFETLAVCGFIFGLFAIVAAVFAVGLAARAVSEAGGSSGGGGGGGGAAASGAAPASGHGGGGASTEEVSLGEFFIKPAEATVSASTVLKVKNDGTIDHNLAVEGGPKSAMLAAGKDGTLDFKGLKPGTYKWFCEVPGHEAAGMKGTVTVQ